MTLLLGCVALQGVSPVHGRGRAAGGRRPAAAVLGLLALTAALLALAASFFPPARRLMGSAMSAPVRQWRMLTASDLSPMSGLAASQVGFAPHGPKAFTAGRPFSSFRIVDARHGTEVWRQSAPPRAIETDALGAIARVWIGDFTDFATPGRFYVAADNGLISHPFDIAPDVFDGALRAVQRVFYFQRAFTAIEARHAEGPWTHASDAALAPAGVRGGWHDAGDLSLYNMTTVSSLFWLLEAYRDFAPVADDTNIPESGNGVPDVLDEARWALEWLLSVQQADGGVRNSTCQANYRAYGRNVPEASGRYVEGEVGTMATARAVGILADAAIVYAPVDGAFAARLRDAAWRGWRYLDARPAEHSDGPTCAAYRQDGDPASGRAVRMFAAAGMLVLTGDRTFHEAFETWFDEIAGDPSAYRFNAYACLLYLRAPAGDPARQSAIRQRLRTLGEQAVADATAHPFGWSGRYFWGSVGAAFERSGGFSARVCLSGAQDVAAHCHLPLANLDYLFGRNSLRFAYVSGLPGVTRGRQRAFHHWLAARRAAPFLFPGAVAGGPNAAPEPNDGSRPLALPRPVWGYWNDPAMPRDASTAIDSRYTDNDSWSTNELAIGWQAVTLYNLYFAQAEARDARRSGIAEVPADRVDDAGRGTAIAVRILR